MALMVFTPSVTMPVLALDSNGWHGAGSHFWIAFRPIATCCTVPSATTAWSACQMRTPAGLRDDGAFDAHAESERHSAKRRTFIGASAQEYPRHRTPTSGRE